MADQIKALLALTPEELSAKLGFTKQVEQFQADLAEADKLTGDARKTVETRLDEMITPKIWPGDLHHTVERAKAKEAAKASGKTTPASVLDGCCEPCYDC